MSNPVMDTGPGDYWTDMGCDGEVSVPTMTIHTAGFVQPCGFVWHKQPESNKVKPKGNKRTPK
jgi:hypothetical protein